jgi:DNA repair exonuclease SbcCD ATPase subunit
VYDNEIYQVKVKKNKNKNKIKIGLWHGTVNGSASYSKNMKGRIKLNDFKCYDYVMLGDIHKHQYLTSTIAYSGSLIQQNHGEDLENHGMIKWDLENKTSEFIKIENDYGFVTIRINNDSVEKYKNVPKNVRLRIIYDNTKKETIQNLKDKISVKSDIIECEEKCENMKIGGRIEKHETIDIIDDEIVIKRLVDYMTNARKYDQTKIEQITNELRNTLKKINYKYTDKLRSIKLKYLIFNNIYVFGEGNCIDYRQLEGIVNIRGRNGAGKSCASINVLLYAIYGLSESKGRNQCANINHKKTSLSTEVCFEVNGIEYKINRTSKIKNANKKKPVGEQTLILYRNGKDISSKSMIETNKIIVNDIIGTREELISSCIMGQRDNDSLLTMTTQARMKKISDLMKIDIYKGIEKVLKSKINAISELIKDRSKKVYNKDGEKCETAINDKIDKLAKKCTKKTDEKSKISNEYMEKKQELITLEKTLEKYKNIDNFTKMSEGECKTEMAKYTKQIETNNNNIAKYQSEIDNIGDINKIKTKFDNAQKKKLREMEKEKEGLCSQIYKYEKPKTLQNEQKLEDLEEQQRSNDSKIRDNTNKIAEYREYISLNNNDSNKQKYEKYEEISNENEKYQNEKTIRQKELLDIKQLTINDIKRIKEIENELININKFMECNEDIEEEHKKYEKNKKDRINKIISENAEMRNKYKKTNEMASNMKNKSKKELENEKKVLLDSKKEFDEDNYLELERINIENSQDEMKLKTLLEQWESVKNHKFNEKCKICMSNQTTIRKQEMERDIDNLKKTIRDNEKRIKQYLKLKKIKMENDRLDNNINEICDAIEIVNNIEHNKRLDEKIESNERERETVQNGRMEHYDLYIKYDKEKPKLESEMNKYNGIQSNIKRIRNMIREIDNKIEQNKDKMMQNSTGHEKYEKISEYEEEIKNLETENANYLVQKEAIKLRIENIRNNNEEWKKFNRYNKLNEKTREKIREISTEYKNEHDKKCTEYVLYEDITNKIEKIKSDTKELEKRKDEINEILARYCEYEEYVKNKAKYKTLADKCTDLQEKDKQLEKEILIISTEKCTSEKELEQVKKYYCEINEMSDKNAIRNDIVETIKGGYLIDLMNKTILPVFEEKINSILKNYVNYELVLNNEDNGLDIHKRSDGGLSEATRMSGYETLMANIAIKIAMNELGRKEKIYFMILDEVFAYCDDNAVDNLPKLFEYLRTKYDFVFVITHNEQIKQYVDMSINVTKNNGISTINFTVDNEELKCRVDEMKDEILKCKIKKKQ